MEQVLPNNRVVITNFVCFGRKLSCLMHRIWCPESFLVEGGERRGWLLQHQKFQKTIVAVCAIYRRPKTCFTSWGNGLYRGSSASGSACHILRM